MPIIGILFMVVVIFLVIRFLGGGGVCGGHTSKENESMEELRKEILSLRNEIRELKDKEKKEGD